MDRLSPDLVSYLNADPSSVFIIPIDLEKPIAFEIFFCNHAFQADNNLTVLLLNNDKLCRLYKAWYVNVQPSNKHFLHT